MSLVAADFERALAFYRDSLGLPLLATFGALAFFDLGGTRLLLEAREREEMGANSVLYFAVPDIHVARQALVARGVDFEDEPHLIHRETPASLAQPARKSG
ncbi:MAG: VOC family protein [Actinomycetota bacterium]|nr:VOC family protein [Actinomycetota bacterium]